MFLPRLESVKSDPGMVKQPRLRDTLSPQRVALSEAVMLLSVLALDPPSAALLPSSKAKPCNAAMQQCIARFVMHSYAFLTNTNYTSMQSGKVRVDQSDLKRKNSELRTIKRLRAMQRAKKPNTAVCLLGDWIVARPSCCKVRR